MLKTMLRAMRGVPTAAPLFSQVSSASYCQHYNDGNHGHNHKCGADDPDYKRLFEGNKFFIEKTLKKDPDHFKNLAKGQNPKYLLIGCSDSRVPPNELTNTGFGELFIHRNVANLVVPTDFNINSVLQFSIEVLKVRHIIVMGHTQCGGIRASVDGQFHGMIDQWLMSIREVSQKYNHELCAIEDKEERLRKLTEFTIREQVLNLCKNQFVQKAWAAKQPLDVHGWICEIETGRIIDLQVNENYWEDIRPYFKVEYTKDQLSKS